MKKKKTPKIPFRKEIKRNGFLYAMTLPGIIYLIIFCYIPMGGLVMAFQNVSVIEGPFGSPFCGLANFKLLFTSSMLPDILRAVRNTLLLNVMFIVASTVFAVIFAIMLNEVKNRHFKKVTQTISILPYFISWAVISLFLNAFINASNGIVTKALAGMGINISFYENAAVWPVILLVLRIWQGGGYGSIVYLATITGIDPGIYEAAEIDGASRFQKIIHITIPVLKPTVILMTLFSIGRIFCGDFGMIYALIGDNASLYATTDVVDTYVYRMMRNLQEYGISTAVGMAQSVAGCILVVAANTIARKVEPDSAIF